VRKDEFMMQEQMKITWHLVWAVGGMIKLFAAKCRNEILRCTEWAGVVMNHHNTPAKNATSLILDGVSQFLKCVATDTCVNCGALNIHCNKFSMSTYISKWHVCLT